MLVFGRRRWLKRQAGEFAGRIRVSGGVIEGLSPKWKRGSARWVRDVLVWSKAPFMLRNELVPVDRMLGDHPAHASGGATIEVAARARHRALVTGPLTIDAR